MDSVSCNSLLANLTIVWNHISGIVSARQFLGLTALTLTSAAHVSQIGEGWIYFSPHASVNISISPDMCYLRHSGSHSTSEQFHTVRNLRIFITWFSFIDMTNPFFWCFSLLFAPLMR